MASDKESYFRRNKSELAKCEIDRRFSILFHSVYGQENSDEENHRKIGRDKAIDLVMQSYNTELLTNLLNRLEEGKT